MITPADLARLGRETLIKMLIAAYSSIEYYEERERIAAEGREAASVSELKP